jgi:hypothetical protein
VEAVQEYLDSAYRSSEIPQRVNVNALVDYSILEEVLKER